MDTNSNLIIALILAVVVCLLILIIVLVIIAFKIFNTTKEANNCGPINISVNDDDKKALLKPNEVAAGYCNFHDKELAVSGCAICEKLLCETCDKADDTLHFCPEHFHLYLSNKWTPITNLKTTPDNPEAGHNIYNFKGHYWNKFNIPSYIITHYRINVESDYIESYVQLFVLESEAEELKIKLENHDKK
jgi:hypothetical protein